MIWLPYPDFAETVRVLDTTTLSTQRLEILSVLDVIHETDTSGIGRAEDRLVDCWRGYEPQLCEFGILICEELARRDRPHSAAIQKDLESHLDWATSGEYSMEKPPWFGDIEVHRSHQSGLLRKFPDYYEAFFDVTDDIEIVWPE